MKQFGIGSAIGNSNPASFNASLYDALNLTGNLLPTEPVMWSVFDAVTNVDITNDYSKVSLSQNGQNLSLVIKPNVNTTQLQIKVTSVNNSSCSGSFSVNLLKSLGNAPQLVDYDMAIAKWKEVLTGGTNFDQTNIVLADKINSIDKVAQGYWDSMLPSTQFSTSEKVWSDLPWLEVKTDLKTRVTANITGTFNRLLQMSLAYSTTGCKLKGNQQLKTDIFNAMDWMFANVYSTANYKASSTYTMYNGGKNNWWDWEVGAPQAIDYMCILFYGETEMTSSRLTTYMKPIGEILANTAKNNYTSQTSIGVNRLWICTISIMRGLLIKDEARIVDNWIVLSELFKYPSDGDGF